MQFRSPYNYDVDEASVSSGVAWSPDAVGAKQSFRDECDINTIVRRFGVTGVAPMSGRMPTYGDFSGISDFQSAMEVVTAAREAFASLPAAVRERFANDPQRLLGFLGDEANRDEAIRLGLVNPPVAAPSAAAAAASAAGTAGAS